MNKEIEITIRPDGKVEIDMLNYKGEGCAADAKDIIDKLGIVADSDQKPEFWEKNENHLRGCN